jgi:hypothetical protein
VHATLAIGNPSAMGVWHVVVMGAWPDAHRHMAWGGHGCMARGVKYSSVKTVLDD